MRIQTNACLLCGSKMDQVLTVYFILTQVSQTIATQFGLAFVAILIFEILARPYFRKRRIQKSKPLYTVKKVRMELIHGFLTLAAGGMLAVSAKYFASIGVIQSDKGGLPLLRIFLEFSFYFWTFDAYFYWGHRLLHIEPFYRWIHAAHHKSRNPDALAAFSFNPIEGIMFGAYTTGIFCFHKFHFISMVLIGFYGILNSILIHSGYEMFPTWWYKYAATKWYLSPHFHDSHHLYVQCNYGGFTTVWDRLMSTMRPSFDIEYLEHKAAVTKAQ